MDVTALGHDLRNVLCFVNCVVNQTLKERHFDALCNRVCYGEFDEVVGWMSKGNDIVVYTKERK